MRNIPVMMASLLLLWSCASGSLKETESYRQSAFEGNFDRILVVTSQTAGTYQEIMTDAAVKVLSDTNVTAIPRKALMRSARVDRERVRSAIQGENIDAVLVFRLGEISVGSRGRPSWADLQGGYNELEDELSYLISLGGTAPPTWRAGSGTLDVWAELYDVESEALVWAVVLESYNPGSTEAVISGVSNRVARDLKREGFIR